MNKKDDIKLLMDELVKKVYKASQDFPKNELYGLTSQLRRSTLSIILNYIEGYARQRKKVLINFLEISYGSLKETKYLLYLSCYLKYLDKQQYVEMERVSDKIGAMLWGILKNLR